MKTFARIQNGIVSQIEPETRIVLGVGYDLVDRFHPAVVAEFIEIPADMQNDVDIGWKFENDTFQTPSPAEPSPVGKIVLFKSDVWRRCTDSEADALDAALKAAPTKLRRLWEDSTILDSESPEWSELRSGVVAIVGNKRATEILAPSVL